MLVALLVLKPTAALEKKATASAVTVYALFAGAANGSSALGRRSGPPFRKSVPLIDSVPSEVPNEASCSGVSGSYGSPGPVALKSHSCPPVTSGGAIHVSVELFGNSARMPLMLL